MTDKQTKALALFSGGLDSTLACRVVSAQGIKVVAVKFVTPFFGYELLKKRDEYASRIKKTSGIAVILRDVTTPYLEMLQDPPHGYGKHFNPCIDCKIFMLREAKKMMFEIGASFLITGEVVGQRPMSQRRDTLRTIELESSCEDILVRPLCAKNLAPTRAELNGLVDRDRLLDFNGRNRRPQMQLAADFDITDYPSPAGGCILADPILSMRIRNYYEEHDIIIPEDILIMLLGRQFRFPSGGWVVVGRNEKENLKIEALRQPGDWLLQPYDFPGPTVILRYSQNDNELQLAASILVRYAKKAESVQGKFKIMAEKDGNVFPVEADSLRGNDYLSWQQF